MNLILLAVVLAILANLIVVLKLGLKNMLKEDNKSHVFKHLHSTATSFDSFDSLSFKLTDRAHSKFDLKI